MGPARRAAARGSMAVPDFEFRQRLGAGNWPKGLGAGKRARGRRNLQRALGAPRAAAVLAGCVGLSFLLLCGVGVAEQAFWPVAATGAVALAFVLATLRRFRANPDASGQKRLDAMAGLWVFACYASAGFLPLIGERL